MTALISSTLIALALIGVAGAALLTGHATFDQFIGVTASFGGATSVAHLFALGTGQAGPASSTGPPAGTSTTTHQATG